MTEPEVLVEDRDGVRVVRLNRPERLNALTTTMRRLIAGAVEEFDRDDALKVLVLTGNGRAFCSGADLSVDGAFTPRNRRDMKTPRFWWHLPFEQTDKPTICALNGTVAGGGLGLALSCDLIYAAEGARILPGFIRVGFTPDNGVAQGVLRRMGYPRALRYLLEGEALSGEAAVQAGLIDAVFPADELEPEVMALAARWASGPSVTIELTKRLLKDAATMSRAQLLAHEELILTMARQTEDLAEGVAAFREKRQPQWKGR